MTKMFFDLEDLANEPSLEDVRGILSPHIKYRYRLSLDGQLLGKLRLENVDAANRPTMEYDEIRHGDDVYAGKCSWLPVTVSLTEEYDSPVLAKLTEQIHRSRFAGSGFTAHIIMSSDKGMQEIWVMEQCYITELNYPALEFSGRTDLDVDLTIAYSNAYLL